VLTPTEPSTSMNTVVLVVEDEALIRMMASDALTDARYGVIEAEHAPDALLHLSERARDVVVICTDVHMPGEMDGIALDRPAGGVRQGNAEVRRITGVVSLPGETLRCRCFGYPRGRTGTRLTLRPRLAENDKKALHAPGSKSRIP
jgi:hypothetical protein